MSLDITLTALRPTTVFDWNITHNLWTMAQEAGLYQALWCPEDLGLNRASQLIKYLEEGLDKLKENPEAFKKFEPENKWGSYDGLVKMVAAYLEACRLNPDAEISVSR